MGDRLAATANTFATPMSLVFSGKLVDGQTLASQPEARGKILLLVHGLCGNDLQWRSAHEDREPGHGEVLASSLGYTPVYLRYNSGLHTSENGRELAERLERFVRDWPVPVEELTIVAHSMGGLLARSAVHYARQEGQHWQSHLRHLVFLGTPHHGAPLERVGHWLDRMLGSTPYSAPFARLGQLRSCGITDLRYGHILDEDWNSAGRFEVQSDRRQTLSLPDGVACYAVAATTAAERRSLADRLVGDGLVPLRSALGQHDDPSRVLEFGERAQWIAFRTNHMELLRSPEVSRQLLKWLRPS